MGIVRRFANDPVEATFLAWSRAHPGSLFRRYSARARRAGLSGPRLVLSFDCDTDADAEVVEAMHERLRGLGAQPVYAVPGEVLRRGGAVYRRISDSGAEFLNHGHADHTVHLPDGSLGPESLFYDQVDHAAVRRDIELGDQDVRDVLGVQPRGFRTPHFGTFQRPAQLRFLYSVLTDLGYEYSSSTVPLYGLRYGPVYSRHGVSELPVTGTGSAPLEILDSWGCFAAPDRVRTPADYLEEAKSSARLHLSGGTGLLNFYADPAHVHASEEFFEAVRVLLQRAPSVSYSELLEELRNDRASPG
jgi:hypothetical protein